MCGIAGFISSKPPRSKAERQAIVSNMANAMTHRGPDDLGVWVDNPTGIALAHRRLAVVDLSTAGHQPMMSSQGRYVIAFNGEIYNHLELRHEIETYRQASGVQIESFWRGHSDTETLLAGFELWGIEATLKRCVGMFAIALWDKGRNRLTLVRDRLGEKPLYYGWLGEGDYRAFAFASELKAIKAHPDFKGVVDKQALAQYVQFMYVPAPMSIYEGVYKLKPGHILSFDVASNVSLDACKPEIKPYWSLCQTVTEARNRPITSESEAIESIYAQLKESIGLQSQADVPLGAFLSGGVDSSLVVALMQQNAHEFGLPAVKTFTIGFDEEGYDESPFAKAVADHLGTDHHELRVDAATALALIPKLPSMYDEPFADSSQIPTYLVSKLARQHVTVALSGDAGDELFGGYNRYFWGPKIWKKFSRLPFLLREVIVGTIEAIPIPIWKLMGALFNRVMRSDKKVSNFAEKLHKLATLLKNVRSPEELYFNLVTEWRNPNQLLRTAPAENTENQTHGTEKFANHEQPYKLTIAEHMMYLDTLSYLPDDILCKVDRAAMACSLETRVPFLDHRLLELAWRLSLDTKIRGTLGKWALRQILYRFVPKDLIERPKTGFAIPVGQWLRGPLREWAGELLSKGRLETEGYFHAEPILAKWKEHQSGKRDHTASLWTILMFQAWLQEHHAN